MFVIIEISWKGVWRCLRRLLHGTITEKSWENRSELHRQAAKMPELNSAF